MALFGKRASIDRELERLRPQPIQSAPIGSSQFVEAPKVQTGGNAEALARALGQFSSALAQFGNTQAQKSRSPEAHQKAIDEATAGKTPEEIYEFMRNEGFDDRPFLQRQAIAALAASGDARKFNVAMADYFSNTEDGQGYDWEAGNAIEEINAARMERFEQIKALSGDMPAAAFWRATEKSVERFEDGEFKRMYETAKGKLGDSIFDHLITLGEEAAFEQEDLSGEAIARLILDEMEILPGISNMTRDEQMLMTARVAEKYADLGKPKVVKALFELPRGNAGALGRTTKYAKRARDLTLEAHRNERIIAREGEEGVMAILKDAVRDGQFDRQYWEGLDQKTRDMYTEEEGSRQKPRPPSRRAKTSGGPRYSPPMPPTVCGPPRGPMEASRRRPSHTPTTSAIGLPGRSVLRISRTI
jgi:hypothetical protein